VSDKQSQADYYQENRIKRPHENKQTSESEKSADVDSDFPRFRKARGTVVDLSPGQVLYIPPYWFVLTEAADTELSVGLDVVSVSRAQAVLAEAYAMALPFRNFSHATKEERIIATQVTILFTNLTSLDILTFLFYVGSFVRSFVRSYY
jgi:hypothetical protein